MVSKATREWREHKKRRTWKQSQAFVGLLGPSFPRLQIVEDDDDEDDGETSGTEATPVNFAIEDAGSSDDDEEYIRQAPRWTRMYS